MLSTEKMRTLGQLFSWKLSFLRKLKKIKSVPLFRRNYCFGQIKMVGPAKTKTVCFIASAVIVWSLFEFGEAIVFWIDHKIKPTEILRNLEISPDRYRLCVGFLALFSSASCFVCLDPIYIPLCILSWMLDCWSPYGECSIIPSFFIKIMICIYLTTEIYGIFVVEICKPIQEKEEAEEKKESENIWPKSKQRMG